MMTQNSTQMSSDTETSQKNQISKRYPKPHMIIPDEDMAWAMDQRSPVYKLWGECWRADPYGSRWILLKTSLGAENFKKAKKPLMESGLFLFENRLTVANGQRLYQWWIKNLHGCRSSYWKQQSIEVDAQNIEDPEVSDRIEKTDDNEIGTDNTTLTEIGNCCTEVGNNRTEVGVDSTGVGNNRTEVGAVSTAQPYLNSLVERISKALSNSSVTLQEHFIISLTIGEREKFLSFCLEKIKQLADRGTEVHTDCGWIAKHYEQYWNEFCKTRGAIAKTQDWANHPRRDEWIEEIRQGRPRFIALGGPREERAMRISFSEWAHANNLVWGAES